jgi:tetratricopeptide (TPR) repeat protein
MKTFHSGSRCFWAVLVLVAGVLLASCQPPKRVAPPERPKKPSLMERAESALEQEDFEQASKLYLKALEEEDLSRQLEIRAWQGVARSALQSGRPDLARRSLKRWRVLEPDTSDTWAWQKIRSGLIRRQEGPEAYASHLRDLLDPERPWSLVRQAARALTDLYSQREEPQKISGVLKRLDQVAQGEDQRGKVLDFAQDVISDMPDKRRQELFQAAPEAERDRFPAVIVSWERALDRFRLDEADWKDTWDDLAAVLEKTGPFVRSRLGGKLRKLEQKHGRPATGVVLLLPLSGGYGDIAWKIGRGSDAAQWSMSRKGRPIRLKAINTQEDGWLKRLSRLSATYSLVGGPVRESSWKKLHQAGLHQDFEVFTFRSELGRGTEGEDAYRFFPGRDDQVRALMEVSRDELDISSFGVLYPKSSFGRSMARSFWNATVQEDVQLNGLGFYNPRRITSYEEKVSDYLHVPEDYGKEDKQEANATNATQNATRIPKPDFEAVFLPDSFSRARILIPEFFFFNQPDMVFLGPALWEQEIKRISGLDTRYFNLTLMASPWWPDNASRQLKLLRHTLKQGVQEGPDFWVGLGYDFVRFAAQLGPKAGDSSNGDLSRKLAGMSGFEWTLAPISWNEQGRARQDLFILRPTPDGVARVQSEKLSSRLEKAREMKRKWRQRTQGNATKQVNATGGDLNATLEELNATGTSGESDSDW